MLQGAYNASIFLIPLSRPLELCCWARAQLTAKDFSAFVTHKSLLLFSFVNQLTLYYNTAAAQSGAHTSCRGYIAYTRRREMFERINVLIGGNFL
jgi:hypothetical protein